MITTVGPSKEGDHMGDELLERGSHDYGALAILCEQRRTRRRPVLPLVLAPHVVDRDVIPQDLGGYDDDGQ